MPPPSSPGRPWNLRLLGGAIGLVAAVAVLLGLGLPYIQNLRSSTADAQQATLRPAPIDGARAYGYLKEICALGPRPAGSAANAKQRQLVAEHFKKHGASVREQPFRARDPISGDPVALANLIGSWFPDRAERVVIGVHYDTRPFPDLDPDPVRREGPFLGANDGASGVALLMEIANHLADSPTPWGVDLVLFDGEELVYNQVGEYFLGSKAFARAYQAEHRGSKAKARYAYGLVLDMIGDRDLAIKQEPYSLNLAPRLVRDVWTVAERLNATGFKSQRGPQVLDDHLALNDAGIPTIDLIDFDYPAWHTADDLPTQCSGESLGEVGRVVTAWLALPKPRLRKR